MQLCEIKGLGEKRISALKKVGIIRPEELLLYYPYKYLDLTKCPDFLAMQDGEEVVFLGEVAAEPVFKFVRRGLSFVKTTFFARDVTHSTDCLSILATFFNQRFVAKQLVVGKKFYVSGKIKHFKKNVEIQCPILIPYKNDNKLCIPLYKPIIGLPVSVLTEAVGQAVNALKIESFVPAELTRKYGLLSLQEAIRATHFPRDITEAICANESIAVESLAVKLCAYRIFKTGKSDKRVFLYDQTQLTLVEALIEKLPYRLTNDQRAAINRLLCGLNNPDKVLNALLSGDVGCGKTIVAFLLLYYCALSGYQSVLMAPTEILALQHYRSAIELLEGTGVQVCILTSSQPAALRKKNLSHIKSGMAKIIVGTHAVIQKAVVFQNLSLVITDEQHRFGVLQRGNLENKSILADSVVMSATPIPRSLALVLYGDLESVEIREKPPKRIETKTRFVPPEKENELYKYLLQKCENGEQCFVVCPRIEEDGESDLPSVTEMYNRLSPIFKNQGIRALHGKLLDAEKNEIMARFAKKECKILVTTTVIEVGIDYKDATSIVILNAERYGLSQLHQLRGRVGRGENESYCFLLSQKDTAKSRLEFFAKNNNGFDLAEYDFIDRGAGDFLGTRQHGVSSARITPEIIKNAKQLADELIALPEFTSRIPQDSNTNNYEFIRNLSLS